MADNTEKLVTLSNLSDNAEEMKRILKQVRAYIDKKDDTKVDKVDGKGLSSNDYTSAEKNKLAALENYDDSVLAAQVESLEQSLNTLVGNNASEAIDNFNEILKFLSGITDTQTLEGLLSNIREDMQNYLSQKVDKESGKQLSTNDYTTAEKNKLAGIEAGAQKNTVTGIKGNAESSYRTGNVNLTPANIGAAAASHTHSIANVTDLQTALDGKAAASHSHAISDVNNLQTTLDGKAAKSHTHSASEITSGTLSMERIADKSITKEKLADGIFTETDNILISTIYIDQNITDPASMISGDINGAAIQAIRANSHRYLGKYTAENTMTICQLNDVNSNQYADGSPAILTGAEGDVFMRLPIFYTKTIELYEDRWQIMFAFGGKPKGDGWIRWGGEDLIGVYEGYVSGSRLYSRSGVNPSGNSTQAQLKSYARSRGTGFAIVKLRHLNLITFLNLAYYGNTDIKKLCGTGPTTDTVTGNTNSMGMTSTMKDNGTSASNNAWGIENFYGGNNEFIDNVTADVDKLRVVEDDGTIRLINRAVGYYGWMAKMLIGENLDIITKDSSSVNSNTLGLCSFHWDEGKGTGEIMRYNGEKGNKEIGFATYYIAYNKDRTDYGRLSFTGSIAEEKNPENFKSLTAIG